MSGKGRKHIGKISGFFSPPERTLCVRHHAAKAAPAGADPQRLATTRNPPWSPPDVVCAVPVPLVSCASTVMLITVSTFMASWWWAVLTAVAVLAILVHFVLKRPAVRDVVDRRLLRVPVLGSMFLRLEVARISRTLGALVDGGVRILDALRITAGTAKNLAVKRSFSSVIDGVAAGGSLADLLAQARLYPPLVVNLVRTGENTGELPEMLKELSAIYEDEAERAVTGAVKLLEPMLIVVMGGIIASIVAAVILPVFQANATVG